MRSLDSYVSDVVKRLPRRQRVDVALELKSLLAEELAGETAPGPPWSAPSSCCAPSAGRPTSPPGTGRR